MGNQITSQVAQLDYYLHDLSGFVYESSLGIGRFLKTLKCIHDEGTVVIKVYLKRENTENQSLKEHAEKLMEIRENFSLIENPNVLNFQKWVETDKAGYLIRQYFINNLYDRISTRPFLTIIEKKWISFQLLIALSQSHFYGIFHGDIKSQNIMVTSWNWIYLTDFASYKPTFIPEDNTADFSFFFDTSGRRTCYLAPERFYAFSPSQGSLTPEMDIFSTGCVIAELFLDGVPLFNYSQLISYRKGEYDPEIIINKINDTEIQNLIKHMIQKDPSKRYSAQQYIKLWTPNTFPKYFQFLHNYISFLMKMEPEKKINTVFTNFNKLIDIFNEKISDKIIFKNEPEENENEEIENKEILSESSQNQFSISPTTIENELSNINEQLEELNKEDPFFSVLVETENLMHQVESTISEEISNNRKEKFSSFKEMKLPKLEPITVPIINNQMIIENSPVKLPNNTNNISIANEGLIIVLNIICSFTHSLKFVSSKLTTLELYSLFSQHLDCDIKLQRIIPYIVSLLNEDSALVRVTALRILTSVIEKIDSFPPSDSHVFPAYILPSLSKFTNEDQEEIVREAFAECLPRLAETAKKFLEISQLFKNSGVNSSETDILSYQENYESELAEIQDSFYDIVVEILTKDSSTSVKKTLLSDITRMCIFFGRQKTNDFLLPLIISFLNARDDWELRCAFFNNIVGVSVFVGMDSLEINILPCILQILADEEEFVIDKAVNSLASLCELRLFRKPKLIEIAEKTAPMLYYPNMWIRYGVIAIMAAIAAQLPLADIHCFLIPTLELFLITPITEINESNLLEALKTPVSRSNFQKAMECAYEVLNQIDEKKEKDLNMGESKIFNKNISIKETNIQKIEYIDPFEVSFLNKLENLSISKEEEDKLFSMRNFIKMASRSLFSSKTKKIHKLEENTNPSNLESLPNITIHSVSIPNPIEKKTLSHRIRHNPSNLSSSSSNININVGKTISSPSKSEEWKYVFGTTINSPKMNRDSPISKTKAIHTIPDYSPSLASTKGAKNFIPSSLPSNLFPPPLPDLGILETSLPGETLKDFQPKGILIAHLHEHKASINQVQISQDNVFFVSCSNDGTVKIWDSQRLEKNVTNRSRLTYSSQGGKIKSLVICENSHSIASGSDNGTIHVFRVEYTNKKDSSLNRYTGLSTVKNIDQSNGAIISLNHYNTNSQSLIVYATTKGLICGWDLRMKKEAWCLHNPIHLGLLTAFVIEQKKNWLVSGTSSGYYTCWDLRFHLPVKSWGYPKREKIHKLVNFNSIKNQSWIFSTSGINNEFSVWDVEFGICKQFFRILPTEENPPISSLNPVNIPNTFDYRIEEIEQPIISHTHGIKAIYNPVNVPYVITGGDDKRIRYWDLENVNNSYTICGLHSNYIIPQYNSYIQDSITIYQEFPTYNSNLEQKGMIKGQNLPSVIHHESILDIQCIEIPHKMLISCSRDGIIKVWK